MSDPRILPDTTLDTYGADIKRANDNDLGHVWLWRAQELLEHGKALAEQVNHWKSRADEAGRGFARVCEDAARISARNVELAEQVERQTRRADNYAACNAENASMIADLRSRLGNDHEHDERCVADAAEMGRMYARSEARAEKAEARADAAEQRLAAVEKVHAEYFDMVADPWDAGPEPEDVWRYDRDFRAALLTKEAP